MKQVGFIGAAVLAAVLLSGCSGGGGSKTVATVNGDKITEAEYFERVQGVTATELQNSLNPQLPPSAGRAGEYAMHNLILEKLIDQVAVQRKLVPTDAEVNAYVAFAKKYRDRFMPPDPHRDEAGWKRQARLSLEFRKMALAQSNLKDSDIHAKFEELKPFIKSPDEYHLRVIDIEDKAKADVALQSINKGMEFQTVALTKSDDPISAPRMGDIGFVPEPALQQQMPHLAAAVKKLDKGAFTKQLIVENLPPRGVPPGTPGQPMKNRYFLAQLVEKKAGRMPTEAEVKYLVEMEALVSKDPGAFQRIQSALSQQRDKAKINVTLKPYEHLMDKVKAAAAGARPAGAPTGVPR